MTAAEIIEQAGRFGAALPYQELSEAAADLVSKAAVARDLAQKKALWILNPPYRDAHNDQEEIERMEKVEAALRSLVETFPGAIDRAIVTLARIAEAKRDP